MGNYSPIKVFFLATKARSLQVSQKFMRFKLLLCGSLSLSVFVAMFFWLNSY